ncbi:hypothetical protein [Arthrobacter sp. NEB 688]|uniref:hypothetical protein n=1 Tax=Arthrobacter sp. NEB 688 TaxID=904039 RepID=UPI00156754F6|nr:hypothetical protein [Arthrobacter sp. NEB 688]QKE85724.1 hypothetical protein HL663_18575 [Arthrobacter sp. NEB 688]
MTRSQMPSFEAAYDGTTSLNDPLAEYQDLSFDTDAVFRYKRTVDKIERVNGKLSVVYEYLGQVEQ